jgi:hypothetical protein
LGALGERRAANEAKAVEDYKYSQDQELEGRRVGAQEKQADAALISAEARRDALGSGYQGKDKFLIDFYRSQGKSDEWITDRISGAGSYNEVYDRVSEDVEKMYADAVKNQPVGGSTIGARPVDVGGETVYWHELTSQQRADLAEEITNERMKARERGSKGYDSGVALNRALSNQRSGSD